MSKLNRESMASNAVFTIWPFAKKKVCWSQTCRINSRLWHGLHRWYLRLYTVYNLLMFLASPFYVMMQQPWPPEQGILVLSSVPVWDQLLFPGLLPCFAYFTTYLHSVLTSSAKLPNPSTGWWVPPIYCTTPWLPSVLYHNAQQHRKKRKPHSSISSLSVRGWLPFRWLYQLLGKKKMGSLPLQIQNLKLLGVPVFVHMWSNILWLSLSYITLIFSLPKYYNCLFTCLPPSTECEFLKQGGLTFIFVTPVPRTSQHWITAPRTPTEINLLHPQEFISWNEKAAGRGGGVSCWSVFPSPVKPKSNFRCPQDTAKSPFKLAYYWLSFFMVAFSSLIYFNYLLVKFTSGGNFIISSTSFKV